MEEITRETTFALVRELKRVSPALREYQMEAIVGILSEESTAQIFLQWISQEKKPMWEYVLPMALHLSGNL